MRVATWNLWWRFGQWEERSRVIRSALADVKFDVCALQEVWHTPEENFAETLASQLGYEFAFAPSPNPGKWQRKINDDQIGIGNAVLSRWPILTTETVRLPDGDADDEGRISLHTRIDTPNGTLPFTSTQLNSGWGQSTIRTQQLRTVGSHIRENMSGDLPPVLCGDFNATPDFDEVRSLSGKRDSLVPDLVLFDAWEFTQPDDPGYTWDQRNPHVEATHEPSARIDYIFVGMASGAGRCKPKSSHLFGDSPIDGVWPSDHFGVYADLHD